MLGQKRPVKLNAQRARELRERFAKGTSIKTLAEQYNVSETTVRDVLRYETWSGAGGPRWDGKDH